MIRLENDYLMEEQMRVAETEGVAGRTGGHTRGRNFNTHESVHSTERA